MSKTMELERLPRPHDVSCSIFTIFLSRSMEESPRASVKPQRPNPHVASA